ncbi:MAG: phosphatase PAP2 family protein [Thermodesulfobacteriota bacterium]
MDAIVGFDRSLFYLLNTQLTTTFLDILMPFITQKSNFIGVIIFGWVLLILVGGWKERKALIIILFVILISDLSASTLKDIFQRIRPCAELMNVRLLGGCGGSYSFPSSHATNIFAAMVYLSLHYYRFSPIFLTLAILIAFSRVYVGVHYPLDVVAGAFLGTFIALIFVKAEERFSPYLLDYYKRLKAGN